MASASGDNSSARRFSCQAATTSSAALAAANIQAKPVVSAPAGSARLLVRGLARS